MFHVKQNFFKKDKNNKVLCKAKDYLVSGELFSVVWNQEKGYAVTFPAPEKEELGRYYNSEEYNSHKERNESFLDLVYSVSRNFMFLFKYRIIKNLIPKGGRVLDYGCGTGNFLSFLKKKEYKIKGIEVNEKAREQSSLKGFSVFSSWEELPSEEMDLITLWHVLEHVSDIDDCMFNIYKRLNAKGYLLIAVPNLNSFDAKYYKECWAAYDVPRHLWHFSQRGLCNLLASYNFDLVGKYPLILDALYISYISEKYQEASFPFIKGIIKGIKSNIKARKTGEYSSLVYVFKKQ